jgi:hypothetical protein
MPTAKNPLAYEHVWAGGQRLYRIGGTVRPGVTSVLSATDTSNWKEAWLARHGEEECARRTALGCNRGTLIHWLIENHFGEARGPRPVFEIHAPDENLIERMFRLVQPVLRSLRPLAIEVPLQWSSDAPEIGRGFAGLADFVGEITTGTNAGTLVLADWKTTGYTPLNTTSDKICGYRMQLAAYRAALLQNDPDRYVDLKHAVIVVVPEKGEIQLVPLGLNALLSAEMAFASRLARYYKHHWPAAEVAALEASTAA